MLRKQRISLVIPCKNEAGSLRKMLPQLPTFIDEILVVDNDSTDNTKLTAEYFNVKVVQEFRNDSRGIGYGFAHQRGIKNATGDIIVMMDGDGTYPLDGIKPAVLRLLKEQIDVLSCHRYPLRKQVVSPIRQLGVWILNQEVKLLFGYPIHDILSGMWIAQRSSLKKLRLTEGGWNFSLEIKLKAIAHPELIFAENHVGYTYRSDGDSKQSIWITGFDHLFYIAKFALSHRRNTMVQFMHRQLVRARSFATIASTETAR